MTQNIDIYIYLYFSSHILMLYKQSDKRKLTNKMWGQGDLTEHGSFSVDAMISKVMDDAFMSAIYNKTTVNRRFKPFYC